VPQALFDGMATAHSAGRYFHHNIKGNYSHTKLDYDPFAIQAAA